MGRDDLINTTRAILARAGFDISSALNLRSVCFDVVGRKKDTLLIIKILSNVDAFSRENGEEMKVLAEALGASPVLIGERSSSGTLEPGIVYSRFGIPIISNDTLADHVLDSIPPFIFAAPGGLYVKLDSNLLKMVREKRGVSLGTLAETAGVSRRTIQMYEAGMGAMIDAAMRLEDFLGVPVISPVNPFEYKHNDKNKEYEISGEKRTNSQIFNQLLDIGFSVTPITRSPFDALTRNDKMVILTGLGSEEDKVIQKATIASDISRISGRYSVIIVEKPRGLEHIRSTAVVTKDEIKEMDDQSELTDLVLEKERKGMKTLSIDGCKVDVLSIVKGLVSEKETVVSAMQKDYDAVGIALGADQIEEISKRSEIEDGPALSDLDLVYGHFLIEFGKIELPDPSFTQAIDLCTERSVDLIPLDMSEEEYADLYCDNVTALELFKEDKVAKKAFKHKFDLSSPQAFVIEWDSYVNKKIKGYYRMSVEREAYIAESIIDAAKGRKDLLVIVELERTAGILDLLG